MNAIILFVLRLFMGKVVDKSGLTGVVNFSLIAGAVSMALLGGRLWNAAYHIVGGA